MQSPTLLPSTESDKTSYILLMCTKLLLHNGFVSFCFRFPIVKCMNYSYSVKNTLELNDVWDQEISQESFKFTSLLLLLGSSYLITAPSIAGILRVSYVIPTPGRCL